VKSYIRSAALALAVLSGAAFAAGDSGGGSMPAWGPATDAAKDRFGQATARNDFTAAAGIMRDALASDPRNADYHNLYAYALRKGPSPSMDLVFKHYNEALRLDPRHRGAHEYLGEAYLMVGNVAKAKEQLDVLERLCGKGCEEYKMLQAELTAHEAKRK
jgi:cytochrome c-type biogenesis protein CcmH/NrfG